MSQQGSPVSAQVWQGGRQGKGREAGQFQERNEACNLLALHIQDHQAKELRDVCLRLPPVEPESRSAIGVPRKRLCARRPSARCSGRFTPVAI